MREGEGGGREVGGGGWFQCLDLGEGRVLVSSFGLTFLLRFTSHVGLMSAWLFVGISFICQYHER